MEAQTLTVWRQADRYKIPRIVFVNKMDRSDANIEMCCSSIEKKLEVPTLCLQIPVFESDKLIGSIKLHSNNSYDYLRFVFRSCRYIINEQNSVGEK